MVCCQLRTNEHLRQRRLSTVKNHDNQPEVVASSRYVPGEGRPYAADWRTDWLLLDEYRLDTPRDLAPGDYELRLLLERPTASDAAMRELSIELGSITLSAE